MVSELKWKNGMRICNSDTALSLIPGTFAYNINVIIEKK